MSLTDETKPALTIAELGQRVGQEIGLSRWFLIDQKRIDAFADATEDWQFIHVDPEAAKATPFGATIAHGFLIAVDAVGDRLRRAAEGFGAGDGRQLRVRQGALRRAGARRAPHSRAFPAEALDAASANANGRAARR